MKRGKSFSRIKNTTAYVMIADDTSSLLWQDIYQNAKEAAAKSGAFLELSGNWNEEDYSLSDYMNIAIAAKVDGIILKPDDTVKLRQAIDRAEEAGIPVITVLEDDSASSPEKLCRCQQLPARHDLWKAGAGVH